MRRVRTALATLPILVGGLVGAGSLAAPADAKAAVASEVVDVPGRGAVRISVATEHRVTVSRQDPTTGAWDAPQVVYRTHGATTCGAIDAQASAGGVAVLVECDTPYYDDQAPVDSVALVSQDLHTFAVQKLKGEAYTQPAISPSGTNAAWLVGSSGSYVAWSAAGGFAAPARTTYRGDTGGETLTVDDTGTVTVIGAQGVNPTRSRCRIGVHTRTAAGVRTRALVAGVEVSCSDTTFEDVDATTVLGGYERATQFTLTRGADGTWTRTRIAPAEAPGLTRYPRKGGISAEFLTPSSPSLPVVAIGSPDRRQLVTQAYDDATQTWGAPQVIATEPRDCTSAYLYIGDPRGVYAWEARCGRHQVVAVSADARTWTVADVGRRAWSLYGDAAALPDATGTTVVRPEGTQRFAGLTTGSACDAVWAGRPGELVRLHGPGGRWPTEVQVSTGGAWSTVSTIPAPTKGGCRTTYTDPSFAIPVVTVGGAHTRRSYQPVLRDGTWTLRQARY